MGNSVAKMDSWQDAERWYLRCEDIIAKSSGASEGRGGVAMNIGLARLHAGDLNAAETFLDRACVAEPEAADVLHNLAVVEHRKGSLVSALKLYARSLGTQNDVLGAALTYHNIATIKMEQGRLGDAFSLLMKVRRIRETRLGVKDVLTADTYLHLGIVYGAIGRVEDARDMLKRALRIRQNVLGVKHALTVEAQGLLAKAMRAKKTVMWG